MKGQHRPMGDAFLVNAALGLIASAGVLFAQGPVQGAATTPKVRGEAITFQEVTVAELAEEIEAAKDKSDEDAAKEIGRLELTERLSSPELARLSGELPGAKSKSALMAVGDSSVFLEPPKSEMPEITVPDEAQQRQIVSRAMDYLNTIIPKLPDFYATRITNVFRVAWTPQHKESMRKPDALQHTGTFRAKVLYRDRKEVVQAEGTQLGGLSLVIQGTFGPVLATVMKDNLQTPMQWHGWEKSTQGAMAVFEFHVPREDSHYGVAFPMGGVPDARRIGYHGEIGIDPATGTILQLVLESDPVFGFRAVEHADIMVEYGSVVIGGRAYTCPVRGVSKSTARYQEMGVVRRDDAFILLDDVVFTDYHMFRSEMRIVPE